MQWIPEEKKEQSDALFDGQVTEIYLIDGHALPPSAIRKALAQPEQEPVAMRYDFDGYGWLYIDNGSGSNWREKIKNAEPLYAAPPQRKWVGLTDDEIKEIIGSYAGPIKGYTRELFDKIEAKLREKNT